MAEDKLPEPQDLEPFWDKTLRALLSLDQSFTEHNLHRSCQEEAIKNLGPLIVGSLGWKQLRGKCLDRWHLFTKAVDEVFGLTRQQLEDQFFALEPHQGESSAAFVMRVEVARRNVGVEAS